MNLKIILVFFSILVLCSACRKEKTSEYFDLGHNYFPTHNGQYCVFSVKAITYDDFYVPVHIDTAIYEMKEVIGEYLWTNQQQHTYKLLQYKRIKQNEPWNLINVWTIDVDNFKIIKNEENVRYIKLIFPVKKGMKWNGNAFNNNEKELYEYKDVHFPYQINNFQFDSVLTVLQKDESSLIDEYYAEEKYAKNVGLIYKKFRNITKEVNGNIKSGIDITFTLIEYGKE